MIIRRFKSLLLLSLGGIIFLLSAELILRCLPVDDGLQMQATDDRHPFMRAYPNQKYTYSFGWLFSNARHGQTNNQGISNSLDWDIEKPTVLVVGDSFIESMMIDYTDSLQGKLEKILDGVPVHAMSHSGANAADYLQMIAYARTQLRLKALVIPIANNDFLESIPRVHHSEPGHSWFENSDDSIQIGFKPYSPSTFKEWARKFALARYLQRNLKFNPLQAIRNELNKSGKSMADGSTKTKSPISETELRPYVNFFLHELPVRSGIPLSATVFVIDCNRKNIYRELMLPTIGKKQDDGVVELFMNSAKEQGAIVIEMCPAMEAYVKGTGQRLDFTPEDSHWNPAGHALVASTLKPVLERILQQ